ncbi:hypothetical protein TIFTF001_024490 [Ficus carica]|uniref:Uncharacterized protein n=1 Tax=Ficus carica TaxID=3494 RepID=A0AA88DDC3_FICCA|nr:hypothetical protein TIFTF001_024490 [Ficus carica]
MGVGFQDEGRGWVYTMVRFQDKVGSGFGMRVGRFSGLGRGQVLGRGFCYWDRGRGWVSERGSRSDFGMRVLGLEAELRFQIEVLVRYGVRVGFWVPDLLSQNPSPDPDPKT